MVAGGTAHPCGWDFCGKAARATQIKFCDLDMHWYGDKCWCADPASYAAYPSEWLLEQIKLIQLFGPATDVITGKKNSLMANKVKRKRKRGAKKRKPDFLCW